MDSQSPVRRRVRKSRGRGLRTTNGCIPCRRRHLKCDEVKPICGVCAKKDHACEFATPSRRNLNALASPQPNTEATPTQSTEEHTPSVLATDNTLPRNNQATSSLFDRSEATRPAWPESQSTGTDGYNAVDYEVDTLSPSVQVDQLIEGQHAPSQSPVALQDSFLSPANASVAALRWFGLLANDAEVSTIHNSWANQSLSLGHTNGESQDHLSSLQWATRVLDNPSPIYTDHNPAQVNPSGSSTLGEEQIWQSREPIELLPAEATLLEHFINRISPWIDLFDPTAQFSTLVAHLAIYNAGLMNAILALASRHLALNPHLDDHNMTNKEEEALQYYYQTLHYVQKAMQYGGYKTSLELLSTTLIISAYEMLDNSTKDWERHLEGVFFIQRSQTIHGESGGLHSAVWWAWLCQDIWAAFREKRKALTFWVPQRPLSVLSPYELATRSIYNTAKVISYSVDETTLQNIGHRLNEAARPRKKLDDWQKNLTIEFSPLPLGPRQQSSHFIPIWIRPPAFAVAVQFFNVSHILLLAYEPSLGGIEQYLERQSKVKRCVDVICGIAMTLKDHPSSMMVSQALYIAGLFTQEKDSRECILELLDSCRERSGWPVRSLAEELQQFWRYHEPSKPVRDVLGIRPTI